MARDRITPLYLGREAKKVTAVAVNTTNDIRIKYEEQDQLLLLITNTAGSAQTVTFKASTSPEAFEAVYGDEVVTIPAGETWAYIGMSQVRFKNLSNGNADYGDILLDFSAGFTGTITALITV